MLDIGWSELMVIGVLALLVVGPKELPGLFRTVGQYVGKARSVAREFQRSMEDAARDVDGGALNQIRDAKREFDKMSRVDFSEQAKRA
ncbi:MAG: Sec-independent protein translocase protein TatB, partial [Pseudomonadota bacterium]